MNLKHQIRSQVPISLQGAPTLHGQLNNQTKWFLTPIKSSNVASGATLFVVQEKCNNNINNH